MPKHDFILYKKKPNYFTNFISNEYFNERKYYRVKIDDDIIEGISFINVETYFNYYRKKYKRNDLNFWGITIIPPESLEQFLKIIKSHNKNNEAMNELIKLTEEAIDNNYYIIHYGI